MSLWTGRELNDIFGDYLPSHMAIHGVSIDSRTLNPGDLFVALDGVHQDGHLFVEEAVRKKAAAILVSHPQETNCPTICVPNTLKALEEMARYARQRSRATCIAITGSVGKTSTKEMMVHVLTSFGSVHSSPASFNNHWGVPLTLARLPAEALFGVFEIGMNHPGEIAPLVQLVKPHISLVTSIAPAHIGYMGELKDIAMEKSVIYSALSPHGTAIVPYDTEFHPLLMAQAQKYGVKNILTFGTHQGADIHLVDYSSSTKKREITIKGHQSTFFLNLKGRHTTINSLSVLGVTETLGLDREKVYSHFTTFPPLKGRGESLEGRLQGKKVTLIDDAYNANLTSMYAGIETFMEYDTLLPSRRIVVLGQMLELGAYEEAHHLELGHFLNRCGIDRIYLSGDAMKSCFSVLSPLKNPIILENPLDIIPLLIQDLREGDLIFVKGSKGSRVHLVVDDLKKQMTIP